MSEYTFLYRDNTDDRDCCAYLNLNRIGRFECGHYFPSLNLCGAAYCGHKFADYADIETILTESEYGQLVEYAEAIRELGVGIKVGDERYQKGVALTAGIQNVVVRLQGEEEVVFFVAIQASESVVIQSEFGLSAKEVETIFDYSPYGYKDRGLICCVYHDAEDMAREYCESIGEPDSKNFINNYIDFEKMGEDMVEAEEYFELNDGRVVKLYM